MQITREKTESALRSWRVSDGEKRYWVVWRYLAGGPSWGVSVFVEPKSDQKPYWRTVRSWQKIAGEVRAYENRRADYRDAS